MDCEILDKIAEAPHAAVFKVFHKGDPNRPLVLKMLKTSLSEHRKARVDVSRKDGELCLAVEDDGAGFDPACRRAVGGRSGGFGLFSIRERLELLGGKMEIDSASGRGSRVTLAVPLRALSDPPAQGDQPKASSAPVPPAQSSGPGGAPRIRVVLVDDHMVMRQRLAALLRREADIEIVGEASDGRVAVALVSEVRPDIVLMDVNISGMNGIEATRLIHAQLPDVRVIGLSMSDEPRQAKAMREAGAVEFLTKSGHSEAIVAAMRACAGVPGTKRKGGRRPEPSKRDHLRAADEHTTVPSAPGKKESAASVRLCGRNWLVTVRPAPVPGSPAWL